MKKFLIYILILAVMIGTFVPVASTQASQANPKEICDAELSNAPCVAEFCFDTNGNLYRSGISKENCLANPGYNWGTVEQYGKGTILPSGGGSVPGEGGTSVLLGQISATCGITNPVGCLLYIVYALFVALPSWLLAFVASFFNFMAGYTLSSNVYQADFIEKIWRVVRDFANIFFILVLLYAALEMILGLGHGGGKKTIAAVIVIALVVNFSLFFTKVVIDSSNILALIFYNKVDTSEVKSELIGAGDDVNQKDIGGALVSRFNPNAFFSNETFDALKAYGQEHGTGDGISNYTLLGMIVIYGIVVYVLMYALLVVGLSLLGRTLTLMSLMIISPFAFVSYTIPAFKKIDTIGFDSWLHKLMESAFVASLLMFILYLVSEVLKANVFGSARPDEGILGKLIFVFLPGILIAILLLKGAKYARKASGQATEAIISGAKVAAGVVVGGAALGTAFAGRATIGAFMKGASTGDTAANRMAGSAGRIAAHQGILANPNSTIVQRTHARKEIRRERIDQIKGTIQGFGIQQAQNWVGERLNQDQHHIEHAAHARRDLDTAANDITHGTKKKWDELNGEERYEARRKMERDRVVRDNAGAAAAPAGAHNHVPGLVGVGLGTRKWDALTTAEQNAIDNVIGAQVGGAHAGQAVVGGRLDPLIAGTHADQTIIPGARVKQGLVSNVIQSTVTGSYDARGLAKIVAKEQSSAMAKLTMGLTGAMAMGMRGGFKQLGVNYGEPQRAFFKDLGNTITEALKSAKINVDLSHVAEVKKEGDKSGEHH